MFRHGQDFGSGLSGTESGTVHLQKGTAVMQEDILVTRDLTKKYHKALAVDHVSMSVKGGDIYGFIGENGAGKTTFMRMICGLAKPAEGEMTLYGASGKSALQKARKNMGALIENPAVYPNMTAMENLEVQRRYLGIKKKNSKAMLQDLLELVGLADTGKKKAKDFSLGMKQRLGLAIALTGNPKFIILDEPTIGLDPLGVMELRQLVLKLNQERNMTILFSSHNLAEMAQVATRYGFLHKGKLLEVISAQEAGAACQERGINLETYFVELLLSQREAERHGEAV